LPHYPREKRCFDPMYAGESKARDWPTETIRFELVVALRRTITLYWPTKCSFRLLLQT
jgi:hypothetical protein